MIRKSDDRRTVVKFQAFRICEKKPNSSHFFSGTNRQKRSETGWHRIGYTDINPVRTSGNISSNSLTMQCFQYRQQFSSSLNTVLSISNTFASKSKKNVDDFGNISMLTDSTTCSRIAYRISIRAIHTALYLYISCGNITTLLNTKHTKHTNEQNKTREQFWEN